MKLLPHLRVAAQQSAARAAGHHARCQPQLTNDRLKVVSCDNNSPVTKLALFVKAGARNETGYNIGVTHCLRAAANLATKDKTAVALTRTIQQIGGSLTATSTKEHMIYTIESDRNRADVALECLMEVVFHPQFYHWELSRLKDRLTIDLNIHKMNHEERTIELLHQAAFRTTVGRPLYAPEFMIGNFDTSMLQNFTEAHFRADRMALVGVGCPHDWLASKAIGIVTAPPPAVRHFPSGSKPAEVPVDTKSSAPSPNDEAAKYFGGQHREEADANLAMISVAGEGVSSASKEAPAAFVLQRVFGVGPRVKWCASQNHGRLAKAIASAVPGGSMFAVSGVNYNYSDCGLFGFYLSAEPAIAGKAARAAVLETAKIANGSLTESELNIAKQQAKADLMYALEHDSNYAEALAQSALMAGEVPSSREEALANIDNVSMKDVLQVAKRAAGSRTSMAAVGDLTDTPYLEQIIS